MTLTTTSLDELRRREKLALDRFLTVVAETPPVTAVGDGTWNARDVAGHVLTVLRRYTERDLSRPEGLSATMAAVDAQNEAELAAVAHLGLNEVLDEIIAQQEKLLALDIDMETTYPFHFGQRIDGYGGWGNLLGELLLHGHDVAAAAGRRWPIEPRDAVLVMNGSFQVMPGLVSAEATKELTAAFEFRVEGGRPRTLVIDRGSAQSLDSSQVPGRPDVVIGGPAVPFLLNLYGRMSTARAALRGVRIRGGRRPWRGLRLAALFDAPIG